MMNVALTIWGERISPVFDAAHELMVAVIENQEILEKRFFSFDPDRVASLIDMLDHDRVTVMICGAISEMPARMITESGIQLIPFISGNVDRILDTFAQNQPLAPMFLMPGCGRQRGTCRRRGVCGRPGGQGRQMVNAPNSSGQTSELHDDPKSFGRHRRTNHRSS